MVTGNDFEQVRNDLMVIENDFEQARNDLMVIEKDFEQARNDLEVAENDFRLSKNDFGPGWPCRWVLSRRSLSIADGDCRKMRATNVGN